MEEKPVGNDALARPAVDKGQAVTVRSPVSEMNRSVNSMEKRVNINGGGQTVSFRKDALSDTEGDEVTGEFEDATNPVVSSPGSRDGGSEDLPFQTMKKSTTGPEDVTSLKTSMTTVNMQSSPGSLFEEPAAARSPSPTTLSHVEVPMERKEEPDLRSAQEVGQFHVAPDDSAVVSDSSLGLERQSSDGGQQEAKTEGSTDTEEGSSDVATSGPGDAGEGRVLQQELQEGPQPSSHSSASLGKESEEPTVLTTRLAHDLGEGADHDLPPGSLPRGVHPSGETETTDDDGVSGEPPPKGMSSTAHVVSHVAFHVATTANGHGDFFSMTSLPETDGHAATVTASLAARNEAEPTAVPSLEPIVEDYGYSRPAVADKLESSEAKWMTDSGSKDDGEGSRSSAAPLEEREEPVEDLDKVGETDHERAHCLSEESSKAADGSDSEKEEEVQPSKATANESFQFPGKHAFPPSQNHAVEGPHRLGAVTYHKAYIGESGETVPSELHDENFSELALSEEKASSSPHQTTTGPEAAGNSKGVNDQGLHRHTTSFPSKGGSSSSSTGRDDAGAIEMPDHFLTGSTVLPSALLSDLKLCKKEAESLLQGLRRQVKECAEDLSALRESDDVHRLQEEVRQAQNQIHHLETKLKNETDSLKRELEESYVAQKEKEEKLQEHSEAQEKLQEELRQAQSRLDSLLHDLRKAQTHNEELSREVEEAKKNEGSLQLQLSEAESKNIHYQDLNSSLHMELQVLRNVSSSQNDDQIRNKNDNESANASRGIQNVNLCGLNYTVQIGPNNSVVNIHFTREVLEFLKEGNSLKAAPKGDHVIFYWKEPKAQSRCGMSIKYDKASVLLQNLERDVLMSLKGNDGFELTNVLKDIFFKYALQLESIKSGSFILTFTSPKPNAREILEAHMEEIGKEFVLTFFPERLRHEDIFSKVWFELLPDEGGSDLQEDSAPQPAVIMPASQPHYSTTPTGAAPHRENVEGDREIRAYAQETSSVSGRPQEAEILKSTEETLESLSPKPSLRAQSPSGSPTAGETPPTSPVTSTPIRPDSSAHAGFFQTRDLGDLTGVEDLVRELEAKGKIELDDEDEEGLSSDGEGDDSGDDEKDRPESIGTRDVLPSTPSAGATASTSHCDTSTGRAHSDSSSEDSDDEADSSSSSSGTSQSELLAILMEQLQEVKVTWSAKIQDLHKLRLDIKSEHAYRRRNLEHTLGNLEDRLKEASKSEVPKVPGIGPSKSEATMPSAKFPGKTPGLENFQRHDTPIEGFGIEEKLQFHDGKQFEHSKQMDFLKLKTGGEDMFPRKGYLQMPKNSQSEGHTSTTRLPLDPKLTAARDPNDDGGLYDPDYNSQSPDNFTSSLTKISEKPQEEPLPYESAPNVGQKEFPPSAFQVQPQGPIQTYTLTAAVGANPYKPFQSETVFEDKDSPDDTLHMSLGLGLSGQLGPYIKKQEQGAGGMILKQPPIASPSELLPRPSVDPKKMTQVPAMEALPPVSKAPQEAKPSTQGRDKKEKEADEALKRERAMVLIQNLGIADRSTAQSNRAASHYVESAFRVLCEEGPEAPRASTMNTILCLDVSESMRGEPWRKVKQFALDLLDGLEEKTETQGLEENVAVVAVGGTGGAVRVLQHLTNDYELARNAINDLPPASGGTPIFEAIIVSIAALEGKGSNVDVGGVHVVKPRIVFVTDGRPTDVKQLSDASQGTPEMKSHLLQLVTNVKPSGPNPIQWVPVGNADRPFLEGLAKIGGGEVIPATRDGVATVSKYYLIQDTIGKVYQCMKDIRDKKKKEEWEETTYAVLNALVIPGLNDEDKKHVVEAVRRKLDQPRTAGPLDWDHVTELQGLPALGRRVVRGPDWQWADQDGGGPGTVVWHERIENDDWVWVLWDKGNTNRYHFNSRRKDIRETKDHPARAEEGKPLRIGVQVLRGKEWRSGDADGGSGSQGVVIRVKEDRRVKVRWDNGAVHEHAMEELKPVAPPPASSRPAAGRKQTATREKHDPSAVPEVPHGHVAVWQWNEDRVTWRTYKPELQSKLEMEYRKKPQGSCLISRDHVQRRVLFKTNIERPIDGRSTATVCQVRRQIMTAEDYDHALAYELSLD